MEDYLSALNKFIENVAGKSAAALAPFEVSAPYKQRGKDPRAYDLSFETSGISLDTFVHIDNKDPDTIESIVDNKLGYVKKDLFNIYKINSKIEDNKLIVTHLPFSFTAEEIANLLNLAPNKVTDYLKTEGGHELYDKQFVYKVGKHFNKKEEEIGSALKKHYLSLKHNGESAEHKA